jgi:hypothetical protein
MRFKLNFKSDNQIIVKKKKVLFGINNCKFKLVEDLKQLVLNFIKNNKIVEGDYFCLDSFRIQNYILPEDFEIGNLLRENDSIE